MQKKVRTPMLLGRYRKKCLNILESSLLWNNVKLPNNTFELQLAKYCEEVDEAIQAEKEDYNHFLEELSDVLICIGGMMRFNKDLAIDMFNHYVDDIDKYVFMDVIDYAPKKIAILYERDYANGYHH